MREACDGLSQKSMPCRRRTAAPPICWRWCATLSHGDLPSSEQTPPDFVGMKVKRLPIATMVAQWWNSYAPDDVFVRRLFRSVAHPPATLPVGG
jgi:hypothetical protein